MWCGRHEHSTILILVWKEGPHIFCIVQYSPFICYAVKLLLSLMILNYYLDPFFHNLLLVRNSVKTRESDGS